MDWHVSKNKSAGEFVSKAKLAWRSFDYAADDEMFDCRISRYRRGGLGVWCLLLGLPRSVRPLVARPGSLPETARGEDWIIDIRFRTKGLLQAGCAKVMETLQKDFNWGYFAMRRAERLGGPNHIIKRQKPYRTVNRTR